MRPLGRMLLWDYERGSLLYDVAWLLLLIFIAWVPASWLGDPMAVRP